MEVELARLTNRETAIEGDVRLRDDAPPESQAALAPEGIRFPEALRLVGTARRDGEVVSVAGRLAGKVEIACFRCLRPISWPIDLKFESRFAPTSAVAALAGAKEAARPEPDGVRLTPEDLDLSALPEGATHLDLADVAREQVLLDLPYRQACSDSCRGLCPRCGADRNEGACGCPEGEPEVDPRLAPLEELKKKMEGH